jgi:CHAT domain-containing protein
LPFLYDVLGGAIPAVIVYLVLNAAGVDRLPAVAVAGVVGAALGLRTLALRLFSLPGFTLRRSQTWFLVAVHVVALLLPAVILLGRWVPNPSARVVGLVVVSGACTVIARRAVASDEGRRLLTSSVGPRSVDHARWMVRTCRELLPRYGPGPPRNFLLLNLATAVIESAPSDDAQEQLYQALDGIQPLVVDPGTSREFRVMARNTLVDLANLLYEVTGDLATYEQAVALADSSAEELPEQRGVQLSIVKRRIELLAARGQREMAEVAAGRLDVGVPKATLDTMLLALDEATRLAAPDGDPELANMRAAILTQRAVFDDDPAAFGPAIDAARASLASAPRSPASFRGLAALMLAHVLMLAFEAGLGAELLEEADQTLGRSLKENLDDQVQARLQVAQAELRSLRASGAHPTGAGEDFEPYRRAFDLVGASPFGALQIARAWGGRAAELGVAEEAAEAYQHGLQAMRHLASRRLARRDRAKPLSDAQGMAVEAAYWLVELGRTADAAAALESGRAVVLTEVMQRESLLDRLRGSRQDVLASRYEIAARRLAELELDLPDVLAGEGVGALAPAARAQLASLRAARAEWDELVPQLKELDGFSDVLAPPRYAELACAARSRPLVYVAAAERGGFALVVTAGSASPEVVGLPRLTRTELTRWSIRYRDGLEHLRADRPVDWRHRLDETLAWLSGAVAGPLVAELDHLGAVTLVPLGALAMLPLHAAKVGRDGARALDRLVFSYAPNGRVMTTVEESSTAPPGAAARMLVVADPGEDYGRLATTDSEIACLRRHFPAATVLEGDDARRDRVLAELPTHTAYHFACHGRAEEEDPLASRLLLPGADLTVRDLLNVRLSGACLAVLSACETSVPHPEVFDEVVGLPSALLQAGVPAVIGSLWEVPERATLLLVGRFYELWHGRGMPPVVALNQAQRWLRDATNAELRAASRDYLRWPNRLTGKAEARWGSSRDYADPDAWAAFVYTGG